MANSVTRMDLASRCEPLSVTVGVIGGGGFMTVVSSMLVEIGFNRLLIPQFMSALKVGAGVVPIIVATA